jgi:hypothetical protein
MNRSILKEVRVSIEALKAFFDVATVVLLFLTFLAGTGVLLTSNVINERQAQKLRQFQINLAEAQKAATDADIKRLKLENRIVDIFGPRQLTEEQSARIVKRLNGLKGVKIDVYVVEPGNSFTSSEDSANLGRDVVRALRSSRMDVAGWRLESCQGVQVANVSVISTGKNSEDRRIALQVLTAFQPEIEMAFSVGDELPVCQKFLDLDPSVPNKRGHDATISIAIGRKIQPILTREMLEPTEEQGKP